MKYFVFGSKWKLAFWNLLTSIGGDFMTLKVLLNQEGLTSIQPSLSTPFSWRWSWLRNSFSFSMRRKTCSFLILPLRQHHLKSIPSGCLSKFYSVILCRCRFTSFNRSYMQDLFLNCNYWEGETSCQNRYYRLIPKVMFVNAWNLSVQLHLYFLLVKFISFAIFCHLSPNEKNSRIVSGLLLLYEAYCSSFNKNSQDKHNIFWILKSLFNLSPPYISNYKRQTVVNLVCYWHISQAAQACIWNNALAIIVLTFTMGFTWGISSESSS